MRLPAIRPISASTRAGRCPSVPPTVLHYFPLMPFPLRVCAAGLLICSGFACSPSPGDDVAYANDPARPQVERKARDLRWARDVTLDETDAVMTVEPHVAVDPKGGFLIADSREGQIRRYDSEGTLLAHFGRKGNGPDEFRRPNGAQRLPSGRILVLDTNGELTVLDSTGTRSIETQKTPLVPLYQGVPLDDDHVVMSGRVDGQAVTNLVHVWNLRTQTLVSSFFESPAHPEELAAAYAYAGFAAVAARNDTIAVLFALSDTLRLYSPSGEFLRSVKIPMEGFRRLRDPVPMSGPPADMQRWRASFSVASDVFWASDGTLMVQWFDVVDGEKRWQLVGFDTTGKVTVPASETPKLLAVSPIHPELFFEHRNSEEPNVWSVALLDP